MFFSYTVPENYTLYDNIDVCVLPESICPQNDQLIINSNNSALFAVIIYANSGKVAVRYFLNPDADGVSISRGATWDVNPFK